MVTGTLRMMITMGANYASYGIAMSDLISPDFLADEDMQILAAIAAALTERLGKFQINLPGGAVLTNNDNNQFSFAGVDAIKDTLDKIMIMAGDVEWELLMPTNRFEGKKQIGRLFDITVYADSTIPKDKFLLREAKKST
jgi:hypothetical protein